MVLHYYSGGMTNSDQVCGICGCLLSWRDYHHEGRKLWCSGCRGWKEERKTPTRIPDGVPPIYKFEWCERCICLKACYYRENVKSDVPQSLCSSCIEGPEL